MSKPDLLPERLNSTAPDADVNRLRMLPVILYFSLFTLSVSGQATPTPAPATETGIIAESVLPRFSSSLLCDQTHLQI